MENLTRRSHLLFPPQVVSHLQKSIRDSQTRLNIDSSIVFTCGAQPNSSQPTARDIFMTYAEQQMRQFHFFKAEDVFTALQVTKGLDLLSLESKLADFADCILMILESPGTLVELGVFAHDKRLAHIVLVINDKMFYKNRSFVCDGPLAKIDKVSKFKPTIYTDLFNGHILMCVPEINERLSKIERKRRKTIDLSDRKRFRDTRGKIRMLFLCDLIGIFAPLRQSDILKLLDHFYGPSKLNIDLELALLEAVGLVNNFNGVYVRNVEERGLFFDFSGADGLSLRSAVVNHYHKYWKWRTVALRDAVGNHFEA